MADTPLHIPDLVNRNKWRDYRKEIWGDSFNWSWNRTTRQVKYVVIHHSVTAHDASPDYIAQLHKNRGWGGIGYHFVITKDGIVWYVGDVGTARANVKDKNEQVIGVCLVGDFTQYNPSDDQILSAHDLCKFFVENTGVWPNLNGWEDVVGHKELQATACPGTYWKGPDDSMYERIKNRIPYTPQTPPVDYKKEFEKCSKERKELEGKYNDLNSRFQTAEKTLEVTQEWKQKIAEGLGCAVDYPKILEQINKDTELIDKLQDYEYTAKSLAGKLNTMLGRNYVLPKDKDNLLKGLEEFMSLENQRKKEVNDLKDKILVLEKSARPVEKLSWHECFVLAIKKMIPFVSKKF